MIPTKPPTLTIGDHVCLIDAAQVTVGEVLAVLNYGALVTVQWPLGTMTTLKATWLRRIDR